jgi:large subunit ribosomal protein L21e
MKGKRIREHGKIRLSQYFKKVVDGALVSVVPEASVRAGFPGRIKGKSGKVMGSRGNYKIVELKDGNKTKTFIIHPIHLKILGGKK